MRHGIILTAGDPRDAARPRRARPRPPAGTASSPGTASRSAPGDTYDPWVVMAAMAMRTERVTLGAIVTPPARRRPWKLAREAMTLDRLSGGRLVLPVGLGRARRRRVRERRRADRRADAGGAARRVAGDPRGPLERRAVRVRGPPPPVRPDDLPADAGAAAADPDLGGRRVAGGALDGAGGALGRDHRRRPATRTGVGRVPDAGQLREIVALDRRGRGPPRGAAGPYDVIAQGTTPPAIPRRAAARVVALSARPARPGGSRRTGRRRRWRRSGERIEAGPPAA